MTGLAAAFGLMAAVVVAAALAGFAGTRLVFPGTREAILERAGWGIFAGFAVLAAAEAMCLATGIRPGPVALAASLLVFAASGWMFSARLFAPAVASRRARERERERGILLAVTAAAAVAIFTGILLYALRAATEPMWSNDFLAIWGLKGKTIHAASALPAWLRDPAIGGFSHPEYPLGLPLLFAAVASLAGQWDDQAMALLYPAMQIATLAVLYGWLTRRGASRPLALSACALLAFFEPLYSGFLTGLAEVPLSLAMLLLGTALSDALDGTDPAAVRRLAAAGFLAASVKNEGLFLSAVAAAVAFAGPGRLARRMALGAAVFGPALAAKVLSRLATGPAPLRDFDMSLLSFARLGELAPRLAAALEAAISMAGPAAVGLAAVAILLACGRRTPAADRLLILAAACTAAYVVLPALAVRGPEWLATTTLYRTTAALAPLAAAGIAGRMREA